MNNETYEQQTSQYQGLVEKEALLQLINPQADIKSIQNDLLGQTIYSVWKWCIRKMAGN